MGRSGSGKDTIYKKILENEKIKEKKINRICQYTTRPIRKYEINGNEYIFLNDEEFEKIKSDGGFLETREYNTVHGIWKYATGLEIIEDFSYIGIGTLEAFNILKEKFGNMVHPIYIYVDEEKLYKRTVERAKDDNNQSIAEVERRFEADKIDFSKEKLENSNIKLYFDNNYDVISCVDNIINYILTNNDTVN